jgi:hypothetical protein
MYYVTLCKSSHFSQSEWYSLDSFLCADFMEDSGALIGAPKVRKACKPGCPE